MSAIQVTQLVARQKLTASLAESSSEFYTDWRTLRLREQFTRGFTIEPALRALR